MKKKTEQSIIEIDDGYKDAFDYHNKLAKAKIKGPENSVILSKLYFYPEIASWIADGDTLEQFLNFKDAVRLIRIGLYTWLLKQPKEIVLKSKTVNRSKVIKTKDVLKSLEKEEPNLKCWKKEKK